MNALLQRLQIDLPIFQGPMTGSDTPQLAAASSGVLPIGVWPCVIIRSRTSGSCSTARSSRCSRSTIGFGVPAGA